MGFIVGPKGVYRPIEVYRVFRGVWDARWDLKGSSRGPCEGFLKGSTRVL